MLPCVCILTIKVGRRHARASQALVESQLLIAQKYQLCLWYSLPSEQSKGLRHSFFAYACQGWEMMLCLRLWLTRLRAWLSTWWVCVTHKSIRWVYVTHKTTTRLAPMVCRSDKNTSLLQRKEYMFISVYIRQAPALSVTAFTKRAIFSFIFAVQTYMIMQRIHLFHLLPQVLWHFGLAVKHAHVNSYA